MAQLKRLARKAVWELAGKAHACHFNPKHQIRKGDYRLSIPEGQRAGYKLYCSHCGKRAIEEGIADLKGILNQLNDLIGPPLTQTG